MLRPHVEKVEELFGSSSTQAEANVRRCSGLKLRCEVFLSLLRCNSV